MVSPFPRLQTAVVIFGLILGNASPVNPAVFTLASIGAAATYALSAGSTLASVSMNSISPTGYKVTCAIMVENWTRYSLQDGTPRVAEGAVPTVPSSILPSKREAFSVRKVHSSVHGTWGTVSWLVKGTSRRFVLMWSIPYNYRRYTNWMAAGMTRKGLTTQADANKWFEQMYSGKTSSDLNFVLQQYYDTTDPIIYRDEEFEIVAVMTNSHRAQIKVTFRPVEGNWQALSKQISNLVDKPQCKKTCTC